VKLSSGLLAGPVSVASVCAIGFWYAGGTADAVAGTSPDMDDDYSSWAVDWTAPGPDAPPVGRSLFDHRVTERTGSGSIYRAPSTRSLVRGTHH
jgi:hypothetical protein